MKIATLCQTRSLENFTASALRTSDFQAVHHQHLSSLLSALRADDIQAVLLEDNDEQIDGWLVALRLQAGRSLPVVVVGLGDSVGISRALQRGADDYAVVADGTETLVHRLRGRIGSRVDRPRVTSLRAGPYSLHAPTQSLSLGGGEVSLTAREFALAWALFENLGRVVSMKTLSTEIWGRSSDIGKRTLEQHVYKLRRKLGGEAPGHDTGPRIQTVYGVGYRLQL